MNYESYVDREKTTWLIQPPLPWASVEQMTQAFRASRGQPVAKDITATKMGSAWWDVELKDVNNKTFILSVMEKDRKWWLTAVSCPHPKPSEYLSWNRVEFASPVPTAYHRRYMVYGQINRRPPEALGVADLRDHLPAVKEDLLAAAGRFGVRHDQYTRVYAVEIAAEVRLV